MLEVNCGGGHRSWDFVIRDGQINFSFVREKVVYQATADVEKIVKPLIKVG